MHNFHGTAKLSDLLWMHAVKLTWGASSTCLHAHAQSPVRDNGGRRADIAGFPGGVLEGDVQVGRSVLGPPHVHDALHLRHRRGVRVLLCANKAYATPSRQGFSRVLVRCDSRAHARAFILHTPTSPC